MDSWSAPERIGRGHSCDKGRDLRVERRTAQPRPAGELGPVLTEAEALPPQDGVRRYDDERLSPAGPRPGQRDPEEPIAAAQFRSVHRFFVDGELVAQRKVLQGDLAVAAEEEGEEPKQVEQESDHRAEIVAGSEPTDQPLDRRARFWRRTGADYDAK